MKHVSICIPTYEMHGRGREFLEQSFAALAKQAFKDFNVVISDHSVDNAINDLCDSWKDRLDIAYIRNDEKRGNSSANTNNAIRNASGKVIKILFQDDFLYDDESLGKIAAAFELNRDSWLISACTHSKDGKTFFRPFHPTYDDQKILFKNTVSSPSVLTIKNEQPLLFDENLIWYMDTDYYKRCFARFGAPKILDEICAVNRVGGHQISNTLATERLRESEFRYILEKYGVPDRLRLLRSYMLRRYINRMKSMAKRVLGRSI